VSRLRSRRERFPWFPTINCEVCLADLECLNFCPADVFDWDPATGKPVVARPFDCIPGCRICAENCKAKGISLPGKKDVAAALKRIRAEEGLPSPRGEGKERVRAMPQGSSRNRAEGNKRNPGNPGNRSAIKLRARGTKATE
jgi:NAD-dependent dihydropyrimidine dehydrogenase PreA subunit